MVSLTDRIMSLEAGLDDLQSGIEAGSRTVVSLREHVKKVDRELSTSMKTARNVETLIRHARDLQECLRDQRLAMRELRHAMARLRAELKATRQRP